MPDFCWHPARAEGFGVFLPPADVNYAFHYAKGIRDVFSGLLLAIFAGLGYDRPLAWVTLLGTLPGRLALLALAGLGDGGATRGRAGAAVARSLEMKCLDLVAPGCLPHTYYKTDWPHQIRI